MNKNIRIGIFTALGIALIVGFSFYVNDRPDWHGRCAPVQIYTDDATGLRRKSPVKTLGLDIGFIKGVALEGDQVLITVCVTAPVKILADTKPYIRSSGFLGDKFLELKPVELISEKTRPRTTPPSEQNQPKKEPSAPGSESSLRETQEPGGSLLDDLPGDLEEMHKRELEREKRAIIVPLIKGAMNLLIPEARADEKDSPIVLEKTPTMTAARETELQELLKKVGKLVDKLTLVMDDVKSLTEQKEFKESIVSLNSAMRNLEQLLRPSGKTVSNVNASLESLRTAMAQAEEIMKKINRGEGTIGKFVNDPSVFDELKAAVNSVNLLLGKAGTLRTFVDMSALKIDAYEGYKARFFVKIQPNPGRYYLLGVSNDPRGRIRRKVTETYSTTGSTVSQVTTVNEKTVEEKGLRLTAMFGKYFGPLDLSAGLLEDTGAVSVGIWLDPERRFGIHSDFFSPDKGEPFTARAYARAQVFMGLYVTAGVDQFTKFNGKMPYFIGAGIFFDDDDLKYLLAFR